MGIEYNWWVIVPLVLAGLVAAFLGFVVMTSIGHTRPGKPRRNST